MKHFIIRTSDDEKDWVLDQIQAGVLRQGWGITGLALPPTRAAADIEDWCQRYRDLGGKHWNEVISADDARRRYDILVKMLEIAPGDRIVIPKIPTWGQFSIAIAEGTYRFDAAARANNDDDF